MWKPGEFDNVVKNIEEEDKVKKGKSEPKNVEKKDIKNEIPENPPAESQIEAKEIKKSGAFKVIDLEKLRLNDKDLENSEVLLAIYEITSNSEFYGLTKSNKSRSFWDSLGSIQSFEKILQSYKTETLRKYWRMLSEITNQKKVLDSIKSNSSAIDSTSLKLLTIITVLKDYISGKVSDLNNTLNDSNEKGVPRPIGEKKQTYKRNTEDDSFDIDEGKDKDTKLLKNKRKNKNEELTNQINSKIDVLNSTINPDNEVKNAAGRRSGRIKTSTSLFTEEDKRIFSEIEIIVNTLKTVIPEANDSEIWDALKKNSFNIINSFLYLNEPDIYEDVCFNDEDDYVLRNMTKSFFYKKLISDKGKDRVQEREIFLDIDHN